MKELYMDNLLENEERLPDHTIFPTVPGLEDQVRYARLFLKKNGYKNKTGVHFVLAYDVSGACFRLYELSILEKTPATSRTFVPIPIFEKESISGKTLSVSQCAELACRRIIDTVIPDTN